MMFTILGADGKEYGPVPAAKVLEWIAGGRANLQTRARRDSETAWKTLADFPEFNPQAVPPPVAAPAPAAAPAEPSAPAAPAAAPAAFVTGDAKTIADDLIARAAPLDAFDCLGQSWHLWTANFLPLVGATLLVFLVQMVIGFVPILGAFAGLFLNGVFYGGLYYYYLGKVRGEPREIGDVFAGFSKCFVPLMLTTLLTTVITLGLMAVFLGPWMIAFFKAVAVGHGEPPPLPSGGFLVAFALGLLLLLYLSVSWAFTFILVIDKGLGPWTAMEVSRRVITHQWFRVFLAMLCGGILAMLGIIGLFIGVLLTLPLMIGTIICAYEHLCHPPQRDGA